MSDVLTPTERETWFRDGYLVREGFFDDRRIDTILEVHERVWRDLPEGVLVDDLDTNQRRPITTVAGTRGTNRYKISDLYLWYPDILDVSLDPELVRILRDLMLDPPCCINTLSMDYGSEQPMHVDALFMKPPSPFNLTASWVALEDVVPEAGPLWYFPGSHMIPQYRFSDGETRFVLEEMPVWHEYMQAQVEDYGLELQTFLPKKGDLFIWSAYLYHGGAPIQDKRRSRQSLVSHYYTKADAERLYPVVARGDAYWMNRRPRGRAEAIVRTAVQHGRAWYRDTRALFG